MNLSENIKLALRAIRSNFLRTVLTLLIIAVGITALIGILTSTESIRTSMLNNFREMGSNTFTIKNAGTTIRRGGGMARKGNQVNPPITLQQTAEFKRYFQVPALISVYTNANQSAVVKSEQKKTNPNVKVLGVDENYLKVSGLNIGEGRNFSKAEIDNASNVILLGKDVVTKLFESTDTVLNNVVEVGSKKYRIAGILASKGTSQVSSDNQVLIPVENAHRSLGDENMTFVVNVMVNDPKDLDLQIDEATGVLRGIRKLKSGDPNNFQITKSDRLASQIIDQLSYVTYATYVIGFLTMIGAGIGLMNIMLVSVNERTREIGISKALGATKRTIQIQFLAESVIICLMGGTFGIIMGVILGNMVGILILKTGFIMPWVWVFGGFIFTFFVGLFAGLYPAIRASNLDPVEALRYE